MSLGRRSRRGRRRRCRNGHRADHWLEACGVPEVRKRARGGKRVREGGAQVQNSRVPKPAGIARSARRAAMATGAPGPLHGIADLDRNRRREEERPSAPTVTVVVAASACLGQSARRSPINKVAPTLLDEKVVVFTSLEFVGKLSISISPRAGGFFPCALALLGVSIAPDSGSCKVLVNGKK